MKLSIKLPEGWSDYDCPEGPPTYIREWSDDSGALQISWAEYTGGSLPNPSAIDLQHMAQEFGEKQGFGDVVESSSGQCVFGLMGTAVFSSSEYPRIQIWYLSNGRDFILVTHISSVEPDPIEVHEAQEIVRTMTIS